MSRRNQFQAMEQVGIKSPNPSGVAGFCFAGESPELCRSPAIAGSQSYSSVSVFPPVILADEVRRQINAAHSQVVGDGVSMELTASSSNTVAPDGRSEDNTTV